ncbi:hypothetical protein AMELA_G00257640 [Ameiurus melas]|uniref:Uncharacterized protein n=1 Tax=Ameiurus melas TaxID=219545 RepID=A0A7J5ZS82_AMEME|nr:hypothetical protein AMELA_G00257640 [Ameiurus melas]
MDYPVHRGDTMALGLHDRSLVEDDDAHMKVSLGCGEMGLSSHLQASKTGNTRFSPVTRTAPSSYRGSTS